MVQNPIFPTDPFAVFTQERVGLKKGTNILGGYCIFQIFKIADVIIPLVQPFLSNRTLMKVTMYFDCFMQSGKSCSSNNIYVIHVYTYNTLFILTFSSTHLYEYRRKAMQELSHLRKLYLLPINFGQNWHNNKKIHCVVDLQDCRVIISQIVNV